MNISILGTGVVGRAHAAKLSQLGHQVYIGTQDTNKTMANKETDAMGNEPFKDWQVKYSSVKLASFKDASEKSDIVFNALKGEVVLKVLKNLKNELKGKILVDISNPLDFSKGMPPSLFVCNTDSLGEQIQKELPDTKVVKAFNTINARLQVKPSKLNDGDHDLFICGNDHQAKNQIIEIAKNYGWKNINDLGDITASRTMEMLLPIWLRLWGVIEDPVFNFKIVKNK